MRNRASYVFFGALVFVSLFSHQIQAQIQVQTFDASEPVSVDMSGQGHCAEHTASLRSDWGVAQFTVKIAKTDQDRAQGLMYVKEMPQFSGMLFFFDTPKPVSFWMKNTLIPLDMLFISQNGTVVNIHENAQPHDLTLVHSGADVLAVLELNGGRTAQLGVTVGSQIQHPNFDQSLSVWPCQSPS